MGAKCRVQICAVAVLVTIACQSASASDTYYGERLQTSTPSMRDQALRSELKRVLASFHVPQTSGPDKILDRCPMGTKCVSHAPVGYEAARRILFGRLELVRLGLDFGVNDAYCGRVVPSGEFSKGQAPGPDQIPDIEIVNTEHAWPQSHFSRKHPASTQKSDLHILFSVGSRANSLRNNYPYGEVSTIREQVCSPSALGWLPRGKQNFFLPPSQVRGDVARAVFYFSVRYELPVDVDQEEALRRWHRQDPVSQSERDRNNKVFSYQGNRNPFIDRPEWVEAIQDF